MNWQEILTILVPLFAFLGWIYNRIDKKIDRVEISLKDLNEKVHGLDTRISRIEGQLNLVHYCEPKVLHKKEE